MPWCTSLFMRTLDLCIKSFWKWFVFFSVEKSEGECCLRIIITKTVSQDENKLWKYFPSRQIKGDCQQFLFFSFLTSLLSVPSPALHLNHSKSWNRFHTVLVFMKTQVSKSLQWIYIWYKLRSASHSPGNVPLHKLSMELCPPWFPQCRLIDSLYNGFLCWAWSRTNICKGGLGMLGLFCSATLICGVVKWGICLFCGLGEWRAPL